MRKTACRSPTSLRDARRGWRRSPKRRPGSRRAPPSARRASGPAWDDKREAKAAATGKRPGGKPPAPPPEGPRPQDQVNLTDEASRIMPAPGGGFLQAYNAQEGVAASSLLVVTHDVVEVPNDKHEVEPCLAAIAALPDAQVSVFTADP